MRIDVVGRNIEVTPAIREYARVRCEKLPKYFDGVQQVVVTLTKTDHAKHGVFDVELRIDVEKHEDFICHDKNADLYAAIDAAADKGVRQLKDFKERLKGH